MPEMTSDNIIRDLVALLGPQCVLHNADDTAPFLSIGTAAIMAKRTQLLCQKTPESGFRGACLCRQT